jgi:hypothetical protein
MASVDQAGMMFRSPKLLAYAKDAPICMGCGKHNAGDVVMAHADWSEYGKGMGMKANDWAIAALCTMVCHPYVDTSSKATREERKEFWRRAHVKTIDWLFESGRIKVA